MSTDVKQRYHFTMLPKAEVEIGDQVCGQLLLRCSFNTPSHKKAKKMFHPDTRQYPFCLSLQLPSVPRGPLKGFIHVLDLLDADQEPPKNVQKHLQQWVQHFMQRDGCPMTEEQFERARLMNVKIIGRGQGSGQTLWCGLLESAERMERPLPQRLITHEDGHLVGYVVSVKRKRSKQPKVERKKGTSVQMCYMVALARDCTVAVPFSKVEPNSFHPAPGHMVLLEKCEEKNPESTLGYHVVMKPPPHYKPNEESPSVATPPSRTAVKRKRSSTNLSLEEEADLVLASSSELDSSDALSLGSSDSEKSASGSEEDEDTTENLKTTHDKDARKRARREEKKRRRLAHKSSKELRDGQSSETLPTSEKEFEVWLAEGRQQDVFAWQAYIAFHAAQANWDKARAVIQRALNTIQSRLSTQREDLLIACLNFEHLFGMKSSDGLGSRQHYEALYQRVKEEALGVRVFTTVFNHLREALDSEQSVDGEKTLVLKRLDEIGKDTVKAHRESAEAWLLLLKARYLRYPSSKDKHPLDATLLQALENVHTKPGKKMLQEKYHKYMAKLGLKTIDVAQNDLPKKRGN